MADEQQTYKDRIITTPGVMLGKPVVKGTRSPVERVLAHLVLQFPLLSQTAVAVA